MFSVVLALLHVLTSTYPQTKACVETAAFVQNNRARGGYSQMAINLVLVCRERVR